MSLLSKNLFLIIALLAGQLLAAQTVMINGEKTNRSLRWEDFKGAPDEHADLYAYTYWYVGYRWGPFTFKGDTVKWKVEVSLELEKRSWYKPGKVSDSLLAHEQGHFNIGLLLARSFQKRVDQTIFFRKNYEARIAEIFREEFAKYQALELQYDKETRHFHDREAQRNWDAYLQKELAAL